MRGPDTIGAPIRHHAELRPNSPAFVATGFEPFSYSEVRHYLTDVKSRLRQSGFGANARIAVALPTGPQAALTIVAIACAAVVVPIDMQLTLPEIQKRLALLRPTAVIVLRNSDSVTRDEASRLRLPIIEADTGDHGKLGLQLEIPQIGPPESLGDPDPAAPAVIFQTSGTTADPKLVPFSHRNMRASANRVQSWFGLTPEDRCLGIIPIYYLHGLTLTILVPLMTGGSIAFPSNASVLDVNEWLSVLRPTWYSAGPTLHRFMLDKTKHLANAKSVHGLRFIVSGGAPLVRDVQEGLVTTLGVPVLEHYGSTEAGQICANLLPPEASKLGTCGIPVEGTIRVVAEDGRPLQAGERGEVLIGGPTVISGYLDAPELNRTAFVNGWFRSGDIGSIDAEGFLVLHGRKKELINRGGEKISLLEIDNALLGHPEVFEAAAFAVPHPRLGEDVAAAVVLRERATITPMELRTFLATRLAQFKIPRRVVFVDHLPRGTTGKVQRYQLVNQFK